MLVILFLVVWLVWGRGEECWGLMIGRFPFRQTDLVLILHSLDPTAFKIKSIAANMKPIFLLLLPVENWCYFGALALRWILPLLGFDDSTKVNLLLDGGSRRIDANFVRYQVQQVSLFPTFKRWLEVVPWKLLFECPWLSPFHSLIRGFQKPILLSSFAYLPPSEDRTYSSQISTAS